MLFSYFCHENESKTISLLTFSCDIDTLFYCIIPAAISGTLA